MVPGGYLYVYTRPCVNVRLVEGVRIKIFNDKIRSSIMKRAFIAL